MALQYFHFQEPQEVLVETSAPTPSFRKRVAIGYWQDASEPSSPTLFNLAQGEANSTGWQAFISGSEVAA